MRGRPKTVARVAGSYKACLIARVAGSYRESMASIAWS